MKRKERTTLQDVAQYLGCEAKKNGLHFKEMWVDGVWLCYCMFEYTPDDVIDKQRKKRIEEKEQRKIVYEGTTNKRGSRNRKPIMGKINLCETNVGDYRSRARELWKKENAEQGTPDRHRKDVLQK